MIVKIEELQRTILVGSTELRLPGDIALDGIGPGVSVTVTCEERDGQYWVRAIRPNVF
jgi:hypothetical protein